jgi:hypothetical protein
VRLPMVVAQETTTRRQTMNKGWRAAVAVAVGGAALLSSGTAFANDADVIKTGACSLGSTWKLKHSPENGQLEVEFEVDQNVADQTWKVTLTTNGQEILRTTAVTDQESGSFDVDTLTANAAGADRTLAVAKNRATGEVCRGRVTSDF